MNEKTEEQISQTEKDIYRICTQIGDMLAEKNRAYGDSALNPKRIFSRADALEQIKVRIDDKLSRMANDPGAFGEDVVLDLMGYLVLLRIAQERALSLVSIPTGEPQYASISRPSSAQGSEFPGKHVVVDQEVKNRVNLSKALGSQS